MSDHGPKNITSQRPQAPGSRRTSDTSDHSHSVLSSVSPLISPSTTHSTACTTTTAASTDSNDIHPHHQLAEQLHLNGLAFVLATLAGLYTKLGLRYHSFPFDLRFHNLIFPELQIAMLHAFTSKPNRELPCILQIFGNGEQSLRSAWAALAASDYVQFDRSLGVLEDVLVEAAEMVTTLGCAIMVVGNLAQLCVFNGEIGTGRKRSRDKWRLKRRWVAVLPDVCFHFVTQP